MFSFAPKPTVVSEVELLISFFDLKGFGRFAKSRNEEDVVKLILEYYEFVGEIIEKGNGKVVKYNADGGIAVFEEKNVDAGVSTLFHLWKKGNDWFTQKEVNCKMNIKAHFGKTYCAMAGTKEEKRFDVFGENVNTTALLSSNGFAMSAQVFRKLNSETRKMFKKHTEPITYIPLEISH